MKRRSLAKRSIITALSLAVVTTALCASGALYYLDYQLVDALYQTGQKNTGNVFVIGVDNYALDEFGSWPWTRDVMADVLFTLNADEENQPAAIGVDVLYVGETDPAYDDYLVEAAASADNIVMSLTVEFDDQLVMTEDDTGYMDHYAVGYVNRPFEALEDVVEVGHTNAMFDADGVMRHHLWSVDTGEEEVLSMPYELYQMYCDYWGLEASFDPQRSTEGFWWVDFSSGPGEFYAYSVADILYGDYDPELLKGSIVLIGPYEAGLTDHFITAIDRAQNMYGAAYMANVTDAMIRDAEKTEISDQFHYMLTFVLTLALAVLLLQLNMRWTVILCPLMALITVLLSVVLYDVGWVFRPLCLLVAFVFTMMTAMVEHYLVAYFERHKITQTFQRYVDPTIVKELMKGGEDNLSLGGKSVDIALLFVDIRGFTAISEQLDPHDVVAILNEYLTLTSQCIKHYGGTLDKFIGDCTMAFWGAPLVCEDPVYQACCAAMEMVERAEELQRNQLDAYGRTVAFGVGIHYGPAIVGNIGASDRMDYTAIGNTVNIAERLEGNAPAGQVHISGLVAEMLGERCTTSSVGTSVILKGMEVPVEVRRLERLEKK